MYDIVKLLKASDSNITLCNEAAIEIEKLRDLLVCITHHNGALEEYKPRWLPVVQEELKRRDE